jgi:hypothetical protein
MLCCVNVMLCCVVISAIYKKSILSLIFIHSFIHLFIIRMGYDVPYSMTMSVAGRFPYELVMFREILLFLLFSSFSSM